MKVKKQKQDKRVNVFNRDLTLVLSYNLKEVLAYYKKHLQGDVC